MAEISSITFSGYKSLGEVTLSPLSRVNLITGRNNIGKSAVLQMLAALPVSENIFRPTAQQESVLALPEQGLRANVAPEIAITTAISDDDLLGILGAIHAPVVSQGRLCSEYKDAYDHIRNSGAFASLTWVFRAHKNNRLMLTQTASDVPGGADAWCSVVDNEAFSLRWQETHSYLLTPHSMPFLDYLRSERGHRQPVRVGQAQVISDKAAAPLRPHWSALQSFLDRPRFFLRAQRKAADAEAAGYTPSLKGDGSNLPARLHHLLSNDRRLFDRISAFLAELVPDVSNILCAFLGPQPSNRMHVKLAMADTEVLLAESGTGVEQLLMLATVLLAENKESLILVEEPENHLHAGAQENLIREISEHLKQGHAFITTHSPFLIAPDAGTTLVSLRAGKDGLAVGTSVEGTQVQDVLADLGVRPSHFLMADVLVLVEGITGVGPVEEWLARWKPLEDCRKRIRIVVHSFNPCEAGNPAFEPAKIRDLNPNVVFFADRDENPETDEPNAARVELKRKCEAAGIPCFVLEEVRRLEDLFSAQAIRKVLPHKPKNWTFDPAGGASPVADWERSTGEGWPKCRNHEVAAAMTYEEIQAVPDLRRLLDAVTKMAEQVAGAVARTPAT